MQELSVCYQNLRCKASARSSSIKLQKNSLLSEEGKLLAEASSPLRVKSLDLFKEIEELSVKAQVFAITQKSEENSKHTDDLIGKREVISNLLCRIGRATDSEASSSCRLFYQSMRFELLLWLAKSFRRAGQIHLQVRYLEQVLRGIIGCVYEVSSESCTLKSVFDSQNSKLNL